MSSSSSSRREFEEQLKKAGNMLLSPPSSIDELIALLDKVEHLLANVDQAPSISMQNALLPSMKALISDGLLRHTDNEVRVSVASCISELTRISAPDAPYDDELMKEIFQLFVATFEKLSHVSGRCFTKTFSIIDTIAKVRSCLLMLDLECDTLIMEMFRNFLKIIRSEHPYTVFTAMETIMIMVIDESEDISWDMLSTLLASVRKENQDVSPISLKLGEEVINNCAAKLKPYLKEAVQSRGIALDEYSEIVASMCKDGYETLHHDNLNGSEEHLVTKEPDPVCHDIVGISKSTASNETAPSDETAPARNDDSVINDKSTQVLERCSRAEYSRNTDARCSAEPDNLDTLKTVESDTEPESAPKKRDDKPNSLMNSEEGSDHDLICTERKAPEEPGCRKSCDEEVDCSRNETVGQTACSTSPKSNLPDASHRKRGRPKKKVSMMNQDAVPNSLPVLKAESMNAQVEEKTQSADFSLKEELEDRCKTEIKRRKISATTDGETTQAPGDGVPEKKAEVSSDLKENQQQQQKSFIKAGGKRIDDDGPSGQTDIRKGSLVAVSGKDIMEASGAKKKKISKAAAKSSNKDGSYSDETPKTKVKRKHPVEEEVKMTSKAVAKSSNGDENGSEETLKREVKRNHPVAKDVEMMSKAATKSSNRDGNCSEEIPKTEVKRKHPVAKEVKMMSEAAAKSSSTDGNCPVETPKTGVRKKHTAGREMMMSEAAAKSSSTDGTCSEETSKTGVKRKHTAGKEVDSETSGLGEQLIGREIKVWWPDDNQFYEGVVDTYDPIENKHRILYVDGDEEILNLKYEIWHLIGDDVLPGGVSSDTSQKKKRKTKAKEVNAVSSSKRTRASARASKAKFRKLDGSSDGSSPNKPILLDEFMVDTDMKQKTKASVATSEGESSKSGRESPGVG